MNKLKYNVILVFYILKFWLGVRSQVGGTVQCNMASRQRYVHCRCSSVKNLLVCLDYVRNLNVLLYKRIFRLSNICLNE